MATVGTKVFGGTNNLRYLVTSTDATALTITSTGAASPDLVTDTAGTDGPLRKMANARTNGYGSVAAGALTQAQARAIWLSDNTGANIGNSNVPRAIVTTQLRTQATGLGILVDANVDGSGYSTLVITPPAAAASFYVDISVNGMIGQ